MRPASPPSNPFTPMRPAPSPQRPRCGRLAMMGFVTSIVMEATTGRGTLAQIGLNPTPELLTGMLSVLGVALVAGTATTASKLVQRKMSAK